MLSHLLGKMGFLWENHYLKCHANISAGSSLNSSTLMGPQRYKSGKWVMWHNGMNCPSSQAVGDTNTPKIYHKIQVFVIAFLEGEKSNLWYVSIQKLFGEVKYLLWWSLMKNASAGRSLVKFLQSINIPSSKTTHSTTFLLQLTKRTFQMPW